MLPNHDEMGVVMNKVILILSAVSFSTGAAAYPTMRSSSGGSSLYVYMANSEDRAYNCTLAYEWAYDSFGETKTGRETVSVSVGAKQGEFQAHSFSGSYPNLRFTSGPTINCNPS